MAGIDNALRFVSEGTKAVRELRAIMADSKISLLDAPKLWAALSAVIECVKLIKELPAELTDIDGAEAGRLYVAGKAFALELIGLFEDLKKIA